MYLTNLIIKLMPMIKIDTILNETYLYMYKFNIFFNIVYIIVDHQINNICIL